MTIQVLNSELAVVWMTGAQVNYIGDVVAEQSESGVVDPVSRQDRPLMQATFGTIQVAAIRAMFFNSLCGAKAFLIRPPLDDFKKITGATLGHATGASQIFQLQISFGTISWAALYPVEATIILYANDVAISDSEWTLGSLGVVTLDASTGRTGKTITATFEYQTAVRFMEPQLADVIETPDYQMIQTATIREVF